MWCSKQNDGIFFTEVGLIDLPEVAKTILEHAQHPVNLLEAPMGSGKTTLCNALLAEWGSEDAGSSPTFALLEEHRGPLGVFHHLDAYRLESEEEAYDFGLEEYLDGNEPVWIEWGSKVAGLLPPRLGVVYLEPQENGLRNITFYPDKTNVQIEWHHE